MLSIQRLKPSEIQFLWVANLGGLILWITGGAGFLTASGMLFPTRQQPLKLDTLSDEVSSWLILQGDELDDSEEAYSDFLDTLGTITPSLDIEDYYKRALTFSAGYRLGDTFDATDSSDIVTLATLCPWEGGRATALGQFLYTVVADSTMSATPYDCPEPEPLVQKPIVSSIPSTENVSIYPNPAVEIVTISAPASIRRVSIVDANLRVIKEVVPYSTEHVFKVNNIQPGVYYVFVETETSNCIERLIILK